MFAAAGRRFSGAIAWLRLRPLLGAAIIVPLLATIIGAGVAVTSWISEKPDHQAILARAWELHDANQSREARELVAQLRRTPETKIADQAAPLFITGVALAREAEQNPDPGRKKLLHLIAARYLEEAIYSGLSPLRETQALREQGLSLLAASRFGEAAAAFQQAMTRDPVLAAELEPQLFDCYVRMTPPQPRPALAISDQRLARPNLTPKERSAVQLQRAELLFELGQPAAARAALAEVPANSPLFPQAEILAIRLDLAELAAPTLPQEQVAAVCQTGIARLRTILGRSGNGEGVTVAAQLLIGLLYERQGDEQAAVSQFARARRLFVGRPEAIVAGLHQAEIAAPAAPAQALEAYKAVARDVGSRDGYHNRWLPAEQLAARIDKGVQSFLANSRYAEAAGVVAAFADFLKPAPAALKQSEVERAWAAALAASAASLSYRQREETLGEARTHYRLAAAADYRLAVARITSREYLGDLLRSANTYLLGQDYTRAAEVFREYLRQAPDLQKPDAMVGLAEALTASRLFPEAVEQLEQCLRDFPLHPAAFRARLLAARALAEMDQLPEAVSRLEENLYRSALSPNSLEWRDSLFALGELQYRRGLSADTRSRTEGLNDRDPVRREAGLKRLEEARGLLLEAAETLSEAIARFPDAEDTLPARYRIAEAHRRSARFPRERLRDAVIQSTRITLTRQQSADLEEAIRLYTEIVTQLTDQHESQRNPVELKILRNAYFGRADALFDLARYDEAIQAYSAATNRYQHEPEALEAYVQIAACYRRLKKWSEARGTLEQARLVLTRIRPDAQFTQATRLDRAGWGQLLEWLSTL